MARSSFKFVLEQLCSIVQDITNRSSCATIAKTSLKLQCYQKCTYSKSMIQEVSCWLRAARRARRGKHSCAFQQSKPHIQEHAWRSCSPPSTHERTSSSHITWQCVSYSWNKEEEKKENSNQPRRLALILHVSCQYTTTLTNFIIPISCLQKSRSS